MHVCMPGAFAGQFSRSFSCIETAAPSSKHCWGLSTGDVCQRWSSATMCQR